MHHSREAICNLLTMINIAACHAYWLIHQARKQEEILANTCFSEEEIESLNIYLFKKKINHDQFTSLKTIYYQIAELGGYKNNKHPPSILTIYRGIKKLHDIKTMYETMLSIKRCKHKGDF